MQCSEMLMQTLATQWTLDSDSNCFNQCNNPRVAIQCYAGPKATHIANCSQLSVVLHGFRFRQLAIGVA